MRQIDVSESDERYFDQVIHNKVRIGNFETKDQDMLCIRILLQFPKSAFSFADFCAGSGNVLNVMTEGSEAVTFGIEPNEEKYLELRECANYALYG
ncbi:hypothetical protein [Paenibacillus sp. FSL R10-2734]|uniref:hypothetical protein n=1 Tax=Paenibacillus sp. FSL R10-2734 TaxID=2954691 RepID=UPI0030D8745E